MNNNNQEDKEMQTLEETARVMTPKQALKSTELNQTQRRNLRRKAIIEYIKSKPAGERIKLQDFGRAIYLHKDNQIAMIIKIMMKHKLIGRYELAPHKYSYFLPNDPDTRITTPRKVIQQLPKPVEELAVVEPPEVKTPLLKTVYDVEHLAMEFAWRNSDLDVTILHQFIDWLKEDQK